MLGESRITAYVRTRSFDGVSALLEVVLADGSDVLSFRNPFEAYSILVNPKDGTARIIGAECKSDRFDENLTDFRAAELVQLPKAVIETANPTLVAGSNEFRALDAQSMAYIRENCYRANTV